MSQKKALPIKVFGKYKEPLTKIPNLVENQIFSYRDLTGKSIASIFKEFSPIKDYSEKKFELEFLSFEYKWQLSSRALMKLDVSETFG